MTVSEVNSDDKTPLRPSTTACDAHLVVSGPPTLGIVAFVDFRIGIAELDGNISDEFRFEADRLNKRTHRTYTRNDRERKRKRKRERERGRRKKKKDMKKRRRVR